MSQVKGRSTVFKKIPQMIVFFFGYSLVAWATPVTHLETLKSKFPHGLLTDDFGVLEEYNLENNLCLGKPKPFSENVTETYDYWQCFEAQRAHVECSYSNLSIEDGVIYPQLEFHVKAGKKKIIYLAPRPLDFKSCISYAKDWSDMMSKQSHVCLAGKHLAEDDPTEQYWIWDVAKTKSGCISYFDGMCKPGFCSASVAIPKSDPPKN